MNFRALALAACVPVAVAAQASGPLDRTKPPALPKPPVLRLPAVERGALPNGVRLQMVAHRQLPLVQITLVVAGGSKLDGAHPGLASFTARMLTEGAGTRDANALQSELAFLGAQLSAYSGWDAFTVSLNVPKRTLAPALDLLADVVLRPSFRAADVKQQRDLRLASILQRRDQPSILATLAFSQVVFPLGHPYHRAADGDSTSTAALDSSTVRAFYDGAFVPGRSKFVVVGDVSEAEIRGLLSPRFGAWKPRAAAAAMPAVTVAPVSNTAVRLYLVDKPDAAQSVIYLGGPGADRLGADYPALTVMNTILGGSFSSRLNSLLRETRGYTYGISSRFIWMPLPGPFSVVTSVRTNVTDSSLVDIFAQLRAIRDGAVDPKELDRAKAYVALAVPGRFETNAQIAGQLVDLGSFGLPLSSVGSFVSRVNAVTAADVQRVARRYVPADKATVVVVGDLARVRAAVEKLNLGAPTVLDAASIAR